MLIFPTSPIWANLTREVDWNESGTIYNSGAFQGFTDRVRPFHNYRVSGKNFERATQQSLYQFVNSLQGMANPFLIKDPYDYVANGITQATSTNMTSGDGFRLIESNSWQIIPDSGNFLLTDPASGALVSTSHYVMSLDNGYVTVLVAPSSVWVGSFQYFRKAVFGSKYSEVSRIWNNFSTSIVINEILP